MMKCYLTTPQVLESTNAAPQSATVYFTGWDAEGDLLDYAVTRLPSHGVLELQSTINTDSTTNNVPITNVTFRCWETFSRYRLVWWPDENSEEDVTISFKAFDGSAYSAEATIAVSIRAQDGVPDAVPTKYVIDEDTVLFNVSLISNDVDSDFVSIFITELPRHGKLYQIATNLTGVAIQGQEIARAYSQWEVVPPIEQFATNVRAVSTFYIAGDDAGNGYPSWHAFREYQVYVSPLDSVLTHVPHSSTVVVYTRSQRSLGRRTRHMVTQPSVSVRLQSLATRRA